MLYVPFHVILHYCGKPLRPVSTREQQLKLVTEEAAAIQLPDIRAGFATTATSNSRVLMVAIP